MRGGIEARDARGAERPVATQSTSGCGSARALLTTDSVLDYLRERGIVPVGSKASAIALAGGISNVVLRVGFDQRSVVVKQALAQLRVAEVWEFDPRRILVECACMEVLNPILPAGAVPTVLDLDREGLTFVMSCAPDGGVNWKEELLRGQVSLEAVGYGAETLGRIHRDAAGRPELARRFADLMPLIEGRINAYHRAAALANADLADAITEDIERLTTNRRTLVLGDYSPKNLIVYPDRVMVLDFEVAHWGDPSFDSAFMLTHLIAKAVHLPQNSRAFLEAARRFWSVYAATAGDAAATEQDTASELAVLLLCRVDGKSKLEYLSDSDRTLIRALARDLIRARVVELAAIFDEVGQRIETQLVENELRP
jgi:Phosphotransferase enzyme family